jgi:hypothetical protein
MTTDYLALGLEAITPPSERPSAHVGAPSYNLTPAQGYTLVGGLLLELGFLVAIPVGLIAWISGDGPKTLAIGAIGAVATPPLTLGVMRMVQP